MRERNLDLRVIRTKDSIRNALVELMEEKGFEAITVKDITNRAKINRGTFYAHYQDKFDLMTKCQEDIMQEMYSIVKQNFPNVMTELETNGSPEQPFTIAVYIFDYLNENSGFMKAVLSPKGDLSFQTKLKEFMWRTIFENNTNALINKENLLVPGQYLTSYIASAHIGVIQQWLNSGRKETPQEMAQILSTITMNGPFFAAGLKK
ncbi:TetR/AcrR family transcriptional regulator [Bacillus norwichensis]|uniref:TetR/AcrR family transcriptional regulator n=1 Tax=Bacillus norwichensis TaxID=2762217 RepID=A0ABR8VK45_9BACI|nr:TetR/AcrR family transcriptional regulator [Bacillus norwichensis]MBD8004961.1 TetR/AcrR family transcriptional regulator [Bacillus norwichensis]